MNVSADTAFPDRFFDFLEYLSLFQIFQQLSVTFFVAFFDCADFPEALCQVMEAFFLGVFRHTVIHIGPLVIFAGRCGQKVFRACSQMSKLLIPEAGMFLFVARCHQE